MIRAHIGLGANLGDPLRQIDLAIDALAGLGCVIACSDRYRTPPMGPQDQPDFCNAVLSLETSLSPAALMQALLDIERQAGRVREIKWGPRMLDLDLLHVEGIACCDPSLTLPHPGIADRPFVLVPWAEIAPDLIVPGVGQIGLLARQIPPSAIQRWG